MKKGSLINIFFSMFPEHPTWGQAGSQAEGNVMDLKQDAAKSAFGK
jgi:hypothetical protein